jgi:hypothetical protein
MSEQILPLTELPIRSIPGIFVAIDYALHWYYSQIATAEYVVSTTITTQNLRCQRGSAR